MDLVVASNNQHKIKEIREILNFPDLQLKSLEEVGIKEDIPEIGRTFEENSLLKAYFVWTRTKQASFADDSGVEVTALNFAPGVFSARYAGIDKSYTDNNIKLLGELADKADRSARFRTVITYISKDGDMRQFEGVLNGQIAKEMRGEVGFGYDPLFIPEGYAKTFAELGAEVKNQISFRKLALDKFYNYLNRK